MPRNGRRHRLVLYTYMLNRWWKYTPRDWHRLAGIGGRIGDPAHTVTAVSFPVDTGLDSLGGDGAGGYAILLSIFLIAIRKSGLCPAIRSTSPSGHSFPANEYFLPAHPQDFQR